MKFFLAGILCLTAAVGGDGISANAAVIASCGPHGRLQLLLRE